MESLLSPPEAHVIQSFLASIDGPSNDWALYSAGNPDNVADVPIPQAQGREALAKATKELMALDSDRWQTDFASHNYPHHRPRRPHPQQQHHPYDFHRQQQQIHHQIGDHHHHQQHHASICHDPFPYMHPHKHSLYPLPVQQQPIQDASRSVPNAHHLRPLAVPSSRADGHGLHSASPPTSTSTSSAATTPSTTTPTPIYAFSSTSSVVNEAPQPTSPRLTKQQISQQAPSHSTPPAGPKQNLLSPSQKKANHIQSEQKRRANIRRGYDALCDTVPALREAIREEEEREAEPRAAGGSVKMNGKTPPSGKSKRGKKDDKTDGRAGPRSENVVLSKTIDYINELLSERHALMNRLQRARENLPPGHPVTMPSAEQPLWEREWKGGEGKYDAKAGADADEDEEYEEEEESS